MDNLDFIEQIALRTPFVWLTTDEPARTLEQIANESGRPVFRLDGSKGLVKYSVEDNRWYRVAVSSDGHSAKLALDLSSAISYLEEIEDAIFVMIGDEATMQPLFGLMHSNLLGFSESFNNDSSTLMPLQYIVISHEDTVPEPFRRVALHVTHELPEKEELISVTKQLEAGIPLEKDVDTIAEAGKGMSRSEFIHAAITSARHRGCISAEDIVATKKKMLKDSDVIDVRTPKLTVEDLGGFDNAKRLVKQIEKMWDNPKEMEHLGLTPIRRLLMVGVPGVGKSLLCEAVASALKVDLGKGGVSSALSKYVGESESNMRKTFSTLRKLAPIVFWIDEFGRDMSGGMSSGSVDGGTTDRVHGEFLTGIQELPDDVFLAAAANRIEDLPPEMLRADRFDRVMFAGFPTRNERCDIFKLHLGEDWEDFDIDALAEATPFFTGAEIKALIKEVAFEVGVDELRRPTTDELLAQAPKVKGRVWVNKRDDIVAMYKRAMVEWDWASSEQQKEADWVLNVAAGRVATDMKKPVAKMAFGNA